jgi:hypothetical protein
MCQNTYKSGLPEHRKQSSKWLGFVVLKDKLHAHCRKCHRMPYDELSLSYQRLRLPHLPSGAKLYTPQPAMRSSLNSPSYTSPFTKQYLPSPVLRRPW